MKHQHQQFLEDREKRLLSNATNMTLSRSRDAFMYDTIKAAYSYNFEWMGRPIIQYPQDVVALQELIWLAKPDLIIETGIAHGGSLMLSASMLALLDYCDAVTNGVVLDPRKPKRHLIGIDVDIRAHNRAAIESHPLAGRIRLIQGSSVDAEIIAEVRKIRTGVERVLVCLDSNHTHEHVLRELEAYAPMVNTGSYCVVFDTVIQDLPSDTYSNRYWGKDNNPKTAVWEYLRILESEGRTDELGAPIRYMIDRSIENKLLLTVAPDGYLRRL